MDMVESNMMPTFLQYSTAGIITSPILNEGTLILLDYILLFKKSHNFTRKTWFITNFDVVHDVVQI